MAGEAVRLLDGFGRRYAVAIRVATLPPIGAVALLQASAGKLVATALAVAVAVIWTCAQGWLRQWYTAPVRAEKYVRAGQQVPMGTGHHPA